MTNAKRVTGEDISRYRNIRREMFSRGVTVRSIAHRVGIKPPTVTLVAQNKRVSRRVRVALARAIGMTYKELWG